MLDKSRLNMLEKLKFLAHYLVGDKQDNMKKTEVDLSNFGKPKKLAKKKNLQQIMLEVDVTCNKESLDKFLRLVKEMSK